MQSRQLALALALSLLGGCTYPVRQQVDDLICQPISVDLAPEPGDKSQPAAPKPVMPSPTEEVRAVDASSGLMQISWQEKQKQKSITGRILPRLTGIPGEEGSRLEMPKPGASDKDQLEAMRKLADRYFRSLPPLDDEFKPAPGPEGRPLFLADLQRLARANSPLLKQAGSAVQSARGSALQAGMYPNPSMHLNSLTQGAGGGPNYGVSFSQMLITGGKLTLAQAAAVKDLKMAEFSYRRAEVDLISSVRSGYFAVLVAQENIRANRALAELTAEVYNVMTSQLRSGLVTPYEPGQLGVFAEEARVNLVHARNNYTLAWKQLTATMGLPAMPPTAVAGPITVMRLPRYNFEEVLTRVLANHTDTRIAEENVAKARYNLKLAQAAPIPNPTFNLGAYYDNTQGNGPYRMVAIGNLSFDIPVWNLNQGGIRQAQGQLLQNIEEPHRVRNALSASVAEAFRRYDESRVLLDRYTKSILPRQVLAFRGALVRHNVDAKVAYWDVINAEQNLVRSIGNYLPILANAWQAAVDVASLLQTDDFFQTSPATEESLPDLMEMLRCCHPCSPLPDPAYKGADVRWPFAGADVTRTMRPIPEPRLDPRMDNGK